MFLSRRLGEPRCAPPAIITYLQQGVKHTRSGTGRRPWRAGIETGGIIGSTTSHSSSRTSNTVATGHLHGRGYVAAAGFTRHATNPLCNKL
jgi:hypothetical protein